MNHLRTYHLIALLVGSFATQGCFDSSPYSASDDVDADEAAIRSIIFGEEGELTSTDIRYFGDGADDPALAPINTVRWRRELQSLDRIVKIEFQDVTGEVPTARVSIHAEAIGLLHLVVSEGDEALRHLTKDFSDLGERTLSFERHRDAIDVDRPHHRGWRLVALSGVAIESRETTRAIRSVRLQAGDVDRTFTNMTDLVNVLDITKLPPLTLVTLTVDTGDETDQVFLHRRHMRSRREFDNAGGGIFVARYATGERIGPRHVAIDLVSHGTLHDDEARYDSVAWGIPYRIETSSGDH